MLVVKTIEIRYTANKMPYQKGPVAERRLPVKKDRGEKIPEELLNYGSSDSNQLLNGIYFCLWLTPDDVNIL